MDFSVFDTKKMDEYAKRAKEQWGKTPEYEEYERKTKERTPDEEKEAEQQLMRLFAEFGKLKDHNSASPKVQGQVRKLQNFISEYFYKDVYKRQGCGLYPSYHWWYGHDNLHNRGNPADGRCCCDGGCDFQKKKTWIQVIF